MLLLRRLEKGTKMEKVYDKKEFKVRVGLLVLIGVESRDTEDGNRGHYRCASGCASHCSTDRSCN